MKYGNRDGRQTMVDLPMVVALAPLFAQGDTAERPRPNPRMINMKESAPAAAAPAKIAPQETPDALASPSSVNALAAV